MGSGGFSRGWGPAVGFKDRWQADEMDQQTCVPLYCYEGILVIAEFSEEEPDAFQLKYSAAGLGDVQVGWKGLEATREELELVKVTRLNPEALEEARVPAASAMVRFGFRCTSDPP